LGTKPQPSYERREMYTLEVKTPNKILTHRGLTVRTPAIFSIHEREIKLFEVMLRQVGADDYTLKNEAEVDDQVQVEVIKKKNEQPEETQIETKKTKEVIIEEIMDDDEETRSVLDQLIKDAEKE
jgi:hypothetical protein